MSRRFPSCATGCASGISGSNRSPIRSGSAALRVRELPSKVTWTPLYDRAEDFAKWRVLSGKPLFRALGNVLHGDGDGHLATIETFRDFELQMYVRHVRHHNGGVSFGGPGGGAPGRRYEVQLHDVEGAHYATGSLYSVKRATYPRIEPERVVAVPAASEGRDVPRPLQRGHGARVRRAGASLSRADLPAGA